MSITSFESLVHNKPNKSCHAALFTAVSYHRYKAHFRWRHYTQIQAASDYDLPEETEACASVTSAFLQVQALMQTHSQLVESLECSGLNVVPECSNTEALLELQVLSTLYAAENVRADLDRNILEVKAMPPSHLHLLFVGFQSSSTQKHQFHRHLQLHEACLHSQIIVLAAAI